MGILSTLDLIVFFGTLMAIMGVGLWAGRKEDTSEDYYLAGRTTRWWGVAGSIFGSNVSANHIVGMMGVGYAFGFAQSHFEITAIAGLLMLCYGFLPVYRKLKVFTLSEYLGRRYNDASRVSYALIMVIIMVVIQMVPGFYIGSRSVNLLLKDDATAVVEAQVNDEGEIDQIIVKRPGSNYGALPEVQIAPPPSKDLAHQAKATAVIVDGEITKITVDAKGTGYDATRPPTVNLVGGAAFNTPSTNNKLSPGDVDPKWYTYGILLMALVTGTYTILGGLKAVIITDVIQSALMLVSGILVALFTFAQFDGSLWTGWATMAARDAAQAAGAQKLHLYYPSDHPQLPWSGVMTGLMVLHFYYWGTNQFIVQRALSARSDREARLGIVFAGFFKLLIPFFAIGTGIAAAQLFRDQGIDVDQDAVFTKLLTELIAPVGYGLVGLVATGVVGAILSSLDSMMNSAATIFTFDIYKRYIRPDASEKRLVWIGRICIVVFITGAALLTIATLDPNSKESFFLHVASHQSKLIAGVVVAFLLGMFWPRATAAGAICCIVAGVVLSYGLPAGYKNYVGTHEIKAIEGTSITLSQPAELADGQAIRLKSHNTLPVSTPRLELDATTLYAQVLGEQGKNKETMLRLYANLADVKSGDHPIELSSNWKGKLFLYNANRAGLVKTFNVDLNFFHAVFLAALICLALHVGVSLLTQVRPDQSELTWVGLGLFSAGGLTRAITALIGSFVLYGALALLIMRGTIDPTPAGYVAATWTWLMFLLAAIGAIRHDEDRSFSIGTLIGEDRFWAGLLAALAIFMMYNYV